MKLNKLLAAIGVLFRWCCVGVLTGCTGCSSVQSDQAQPTTSAAAATVVVTNERRRSEPPAITHLDPQGTDVFPAEIKTELGALDVPAAWLRPKVNPAWLILHHDEAADWIDLVQSLVNEYPSHLVRDSVDCIFVLKYLRLRNITVGGLAMDRKIFLNVSDGHLQPKTKARLSRIFHHEMSSMLLRQHPHCLNTAKWSAVNEPDFKYQGWAGVSGKAVDASSEALKSKGFFREYCQSALENDYNIISESLMLGSEELWHDAGTYPRIAQKVIMAIEAYQGFDQRFSMQFFLERRVKTGQEK